MINKSVEQTLETLVKDIRHIKEIIVIYVDNDGRIVTGYSDSEHNIASVGYLEVGKDIIKESLLK